MNIRITKYLFTLTAVTVVAFVWVGEPPSQAAAENANQVDDGAVRELQEQRLKVLQRIVQINDLRFRNGSTDFSRVIRSQMTMLEAKLELAFDQKARVAALENSLQLTRQSHEYAEAMFQDGRGGQIAVLEAKAMQLRIEADLLRARKAPSNAGR